MRATRLVAAVLVASAAFASGCSRACLRNSDCHPGEACTEAVCLLVVQRDGAVGPGVDAMTPAPVAPVTDAGADADAGRDAP
ncbi:MAG: hypothetical protein FJ104_00310 [Deltaproteobacteria bacterium]|nr:hypothetical protein [Deltaproteobacteria bacterium]